MLIMPQTIMSLNLITMQYNNLTLILWLIILNVENKRIDSGAKTWVQMLALPPITFMTLAIY